MEIELSGSLSGRKEAAWRALLAQTGLEPDSAMEKTVLIWEDGQLIATGSRQGNILKCIAVDTLHQGEGLTATVLTQLRQDAFAAGHRHLFLYTKPKNQQQFTSLFFYPIAQTEQVLLMEDRRDGIARFLESLDVPAREGIVGAAVMNCNPFTWGHRYLIETAAKECDHLYVFVLSEDKSQFPAEDRLALVKAGTEDLNNVTVLPTGPYLISSATFPTYFLQNREQAGQVQCLLDIAVFTRHYAPKFGITRRYVGSEPLSPMTHQYNLALAEHLPAHGISVHIVDRKETDATPISASAVRALLGTGQPEKLRALVPPTTFTYLQEHHLL